MPKTTVHGGASYAGHVDVSSPDTAAPEWVAGDGPAEPETAPEPVEAEQAVEKPASRKRTGK